MKRNIIIQKLVNEGFSEKTLSNFTDKQILALSSRILAEEDVMISKKDPQFQQKIATAKKQNKTIETYEELKGGQKKLDANKNNKIDKEDFKLLKTKKEVKEDGWDSKLVTKKFKKIGDSVKRSTPRSNYDFMRDDDSQIGDFGGEDDFYKKLRKSRYNPEKGELELPDDVNEEKKEKWIQKAIDPSKKGSLKKALGVKKDKTIPDTKLKSAAKKKGKIGQKARLALTLKKLKEHSDEQTWVNKLVENKYHSMTTKNEIMELIQTKLNEVETMAPMPKKVKRGHNGIPEFMSYDAIKGSEPAVAPTKPTTKPTTKPDTRPKPKTPYQPGPGTNPKPKALSEKK